jgi:hypothetical protein
MSDSDKQQEQESKNNNKKATTTTKKNKKNDLSYMNKNIQPESVYAGDYDTRGHSYFAWRRYK